MWRRSKNKVVNSRGRLLVGIVEEIGGYILNGVTYDDKEGEFTYVEARGCSVIDYVIINKNCENRIKSFRIKDRVDSDHMPLEVRLKDKRAAADGAEEVRKEEEPAEARENLLESGGHREVQEGNRE